MDLAAFRADVESVPALLRALAERLADEDPWGRVVADPPGRLLVVGMGSSAFAAGAATARMRADGRSAVTDLASASLGWPAERDLCLLAVSATGGSAEALQVVGRHQGRSRVVALTNEPESPLARSADVVVPLGAPDASGVASRSYVATLVMLLALRDGLAGRPARVTDVAGRAAEAVEDLLLRADTWLPDVAGMLDGPRGVYLLAPAERLCSAQQGALMVREVPRRPADACETGDWSHVDLYLAKTLDYRVLLFPGSPWDDQAWDWLERRGAGVVAVGPGCPRAGLTVRYRHDEEAEVRLLAETTVAQLLADTWWRERGEGPP